MKKPLFNKMTALAMGSLMVFSGQALAMKSNKQEVINAEVLGEVEVLIAQNSEELIISEEQKDIVVQCLNALQMELGDLQSEIERNRKIESETAINILLKAFNEAKIIVGDALALIDVEILTQRDTEVALMALNKVGALWGDAELNEAGF